MHIYLSVCVCVCVCVCIIYICVTFSSVTLRSKIKINQLTSKINVAIHAMLSKVNGLQVLVQCIALEHAYKVFLYHTNNDRDKAQAITSPRLFHNHHSALFHTL